MKKLMKKLTKLKACDIAMSWVQEQRGIEQAYNDCHRGDWMLWYIYKSGIALKDKRKWIGCKVEIVRQVQHLMSQKGIEALGIAEAYSKGEATDEELKEADCSIAEHAASTAVIVTSINAASAAAFYADYEINGTKNESLSKSADIVRKWYSYDDIIKTITS